MTDNMEGVQRENQPILDHLRRVLSGVILGAAMGMGAGYYVPPRSNSRTYSEQDIGPIDTPPVPPIGGGETTSPVIGSEVHESPRYSLDSIREDSIRELDQYINVRSRYRSLEDIAERGGPARTGVVGRARDDIDGEEFASILNSYILLTNNYIPLPPRRDLNELLENVLQRGPWRPQLPIQMATDVEYLAAGDQKLTEKPAVSVAGTPVTFWKGPLLSQHGTVECEYFGGIRSMMRVKLGKPLTLEEFATKFGKTAKAKQLLNQTWTNAEKSGYIADGKLAYFTVPWSELIIDASPEYLESRKVRAEFDIGRQRCSGTVHSIKHQEPVTIYEGSRPMVLSPKEKYVIELDEPVKGPKQQNYSIVAISKHFVRPIRTDTEQYIEMTVKGNPEQGCTLKHEDMEIS